MRFLKNLLIFFSGAAALHTTSHILLPYYVKLPIDIGDYTFTESMNTWTIIGSATVTVVLLWIASRIKS